MNQRGHIFVAWGGNYQLAEATVTALQAHGLKAILGGDDSASVESSHLGENVRRQIVGACAALVLIEDWNDKRSGGTEGLFRANLMFEWGYALSALPKNLVFPALVGLKRDRLPSDLKGIWAPEFENYRSRDGKIRKNAVQSVADKIAGRLVTSLESSKSAFASAPFDVVREWRQIELALADVARNEKSLLSRHLRDLLPNLTIPAVYDAKRSETLNILKRVSEQDIAASREMHLVDLIFEYYDRCEAAEGKITRNNLLIFRSKFSSLTDEKFSSPWSTIIAKNFAAIIERKIATQHPAKNKKYLLKGSIELLKSAERDMDLYLKKNSNDSHSVDMWKGFTSWNKHNAYNALGDTHNQLLSLEEARKHRKSTYNSLSADVSPRIRSEFLFERLSAEVECFTYGIDRRHSVVEEIFSSIRSELRSNSRAVIRAINAIERNAAITSSEKNRKEVAMLKAAIAQ